MAENFLKFGWFCQWLSVPKIAQKVESPVSNLPLLKLGKHYFMNITYLTFYIEQETTLNQLGKEG